MARSRSVAWPLALLSLGAFLGGACATATPALQATATPTQQAPASPTTYPPTPTPAPTQASLVVFQHPRHRYSIAYPVGWRIAEPVGAGPIQFVVFISPEEAGVASVIVSRYEGFGRQYDTMAWSESILEKLYGREDDVLSSRPARVSGVQAFEVVYTTESSQGTRFQEIELQVVVGEHAYRIEGVTVEQEWSDQQDLLRALVYTFEPPPAVSPTPGTP